MSAAISVIFFSMRGVPRMSLAQNQLLILKNVFSPYNRFGSLRNISAFERHLFIIRLITNFPIMNLAFKYKKIFSI